MAPGVDAQNKVGETRVIVPGSPIETTQPPATQAIGEDVASGVTPPVKSPPEPAEPLSEPVSPTVAPAQPTVLPEPKPSSEPAKPVTATPEDYKKEEDDLPNNVYSNFYFDLKKKVKNGEIPDNGMVPALLAVTLWVAKMSKYWHLIPGRFAGDVAADTTTKFDKTEEEKLKISMRLKAEELATQEVKAKEDMIKQLDAEKAAGKNPDIEKYSTLYVCQALWGIDAATNSGITDSLTLSRKLSNGGEEFKTISFAEFKKNVIPGSVLIFIPDVKTGNKVVAYADKSGKLKYFDATKGHEGVKDLDLDDIEQAPSNLTVMMAFIPNSQTEEQPAPPKEQPAPTEPPKEQPAPTEPPKEQPAPTEPPKVA